MAGRHGRASDRETVRAHRPYGNPRTRRPAANAFALIDYKTGRTPTVKQIFNDLQLVCYQLGLVFPEDGPRGAKALAAMPHISQSVLFHVGQNAAPARSYAPEGAFQPPLFTDGSLNAEPFTPRYWYKDPNRFFDIPAIDPATPPEGVSAEAWAQFAALAGTQTLWSLTMIARVFYAAAASRSAIIEPIRKTPISDSAV